MDIEPASAIRPSRWRFAGGTILVVLGTAVAVGSQMKHSTMGLVVGLVVVVVGIVVSWTGRRAWDAANGVTEQERRMLRYFLIFEVVTELLGAIIVGIWS